MSSNMMPATSSSELWSFVLGRQHLDPDVLWACLEKQAGGDAPDFRTRLLIRDSLNALARYWGNNRNQDLLSRSTAGACLREIWASELGPPGFPSLSQRLMEPTQADTIRQFLRELGQNLQ